MPTRIIIALALLLTTCKPDKGRLPAVCNDATTVKCPEDAVSKFYFADSSYWIYKDSQSAQFDSVWVDQAHHEIFNRYQGNILYERCYERYNNRILSKLNGRGSVSLEQSFVKDKIGLYDDEFFAINIFMAINNDYPVTRFSLNGNTYRNPGYYGDTLIFYDSIKINNQTFKDIIHLIYPPSTPDFLSEAWYADSVGLIKYKMKNNSVWELVRYKVYK